MAHESLGRLHGARYDLVGGSDVVHQTGVQRVRRSDRLAAPVLGVLVSQDCIVGDDGDVAGPA